MFQRVSRGLVHGQARLEALRSLQVDALTWDRNGRDSGFLNHRGKRLAEAGALEGIEAYAKRLTGVEGDYLARCRAAERGERRRERRVLTALGALALGLILGMAGWMNEKVVAEQWNWFTVQRPYMMANVRPHVLTPEAERALKPGDSFKECADACPRMSFIPHGKFRMGSPDGTDGKAEEGRYDNEGPRHKVVIAYNFAVAINDVTFAEWDACVAVGACPKAEDSGMGRGDKPVFNVTFDDAERYVAWWSRMTGKTYRLLSESEWEYAARAGTTTAYYWGDEIGKGNANCNGCGSQWDSRQTSPVGRFNANAFGLHDMAGNVWQWVEDCYHVNYSDESPKDGKSWTTAKCETRVVRGCSWSGIPRDLRSAHRSSDSTGGRSFDLGFRVARTLTP